MVLYDGANRRVFVVVEGEVRLGCPIPSIAVLSCRLVVVEQRSHHRATVETLQHCTEIVQDDADDVIQIRRAFRYARNDRDGASGTCSPTEPDSAGSVIELVDEHRFGAGLRSDKIPEMVRPKPVHPSSL